MHKDDAIRLHLAFIGVNYGLSDIPNRRVYDSSKFGFPQIGKYNSSKTQMTDRLLRTPSFAVTSNRCDIFWYVQI